MRRQRRESYRLCGTKIPVLPEIAQLINASCESQFAESEPNRLRGIADVEDRHVIVSAGFRTCRPSNQTVTRERWPIFFGVLIDGNHFGVGKQRSGPGISLQQI